uniref:Uncharacterized protein n=1 Tax=viral metagenome TaxID=1070528 RepID=A0A6C0DKY2_9ZZZZ
MFWKTILLNIVCYSNVCRIMPYHFFYSSIKISKDMNKKKMNLHSTAYDDDNEITNNLFDSKNNFFDSIRKTPFVNINTYNASFSKKAGYDERYDKIPDKASENDVVMNLTKFYNDMKLLRELESNISYFKKINLINENAKSKINNNSIYVHDILGGGLLRDW